MKKSVIAIWILIFLEVTIFAQNKNNNSVRFFAAGDFNVAHWITPILEKRGVEFPFKYIKDYLFSADLVFVNLEAPFCNDGVPFEKNFVFKVPESHVNTLKAGNINLVSLANNHILDYRMPCLETTVQLLKKEKIQFAGAGNTFAEAQKPAVFEINGIQFAFFAYSMTLPKYFFATDSSGGTAYPEYKVMRDSISKYDKMVDFVLVSFHWGQELTDIPKDYQQKYAHWAIDFGADIILGHHPHVLQGIERYKNKFIFYSLANFVFASYSNKAVESIIIDLNFTKNGIENISIVPINVNNYNVYFQPKIIDSSKKIKIIDYINSVSGELNNKQKILAENGKIIH